MSKLDDNTLRLCMIYDIKIKNSIHSLNGYIVLILIYFITSPFLYGQATGDAKEDFLYGEFYIEQGLYKKALPFYLASLKANETNCNICFRIGECYLNILGEEDKALEYLIRSVRNIDENYIPGRYKNVAAPPVAWMLLGDAYHRENKLADASFAYHKYKRFVNPSDKQQMEAINKRIIGVGISYEFQREKQDVYMYNFGAKINTRFSEYNAVLSGDQLTMVYTAFWEAYDKIFVSYRQADGWTAPIEINNQVGSDGNCYTTGLSYDGTEL
ncbi:MAG: hypothetical protein MI922_09425, partial [Bacteroidales bacterium]|nr:hypothetical protein [Bacteroidales bacterium]